MINFVCICWWLRTIMVTVHWKDNIKDKNYIYVEDITRIPGSKDW
jgi:hypothetical protein